MDIIHITPSIHISIIHVPTTMVLDMDITTHITETITTTIIITTIIITETQVIPITPEELVAPIINQLAQPELHSHKIHLPLETTTVTVETPGTMVEIQIEGAQMVAVDQEVLQVVDQAAAGLLEEIATEGLLEVPAAQEEDKQDFKHVEIRY